MRQGILEALLPILAERDLPGCILLPERFTEEEYHQWVKLQNKSSNALNFDEYNKLACPSQNNPVRFTS